MVSDTEAYLADECFGSWRRVQINVCGLLKGIGCRDIKPDTTIRHPNQNPNIQQCLNYSEAFLGEGKGPKQH